ncbi:MAG: hypothetical protein OXI72_13290 [Gemmatimonadota bacterium]|nr:hypothetical protein [Gemmatimonadota bacterium]
MACGRVLKTHRKEFPLKTRVVHQTGRRLVSGSFDGTIRLWDTATGELLNTLEGRADFVAYSPDGRTLVSATGQSYLVRFWDTASYIVGEPTAVAENSWGQIKSLLATGTH